MKLQQIQTCRFVLLSYLISLMAQPPTAWAVSITTGFSSSTSAQFSAACVGGDCTNCVNLCHLLDGNGVDGQTWNTKSDALCTDIGSNTTSGYITTLPTANPTYSACSVNIPDSVVSAIQSNPARFGSVNTSDPSSVCAAAGLLRDMCTFHNSQVQQQCKAVAAIEGGSWSNTDGSTKDDSTGLSIIPSAKKANIALLTIDLSGVIICGAGCITQNPAAMTACGLMGIVEGATEFGISMAMASDGIQNYVSAAAGALGVGGGAATLLTADKASTISKQQGRSRSTVDTERNALIDSENELKKAEAADKAGSSPATKQAVGDAEATVQRSKNSLQKATDEAEGLVKEAEGNKKQGRAAACGTLATFVGLAAVRTYNLNTMQNVLSNACSAVNSLLGTAQPATNSGSSSTSSGYSATTSASSSSTTGTSGSGSSASTAGGAISTQDQYNAVNKCVSQGGTYAACVAAATAGTSGADANLASNIPSALTGALSSVLPQAASLAQQAASSGLGGAVGAALPGNSGDLGAAIVGVANSAEQDAAKLAAAAGLGVAAYSGGGGISKSGSSDSSNPFGNLFGAQVGGGAAGAHGAGIATFGKGPQAPDIWHANTPMNLFEIVSGKIERVTERVK